MIYDEADGDRTGLGDFSIIYNHEARNPANVHEMHLDKNNKTGLNYAWNDKVSLVQSIRGKWRCLIYI